MNNNKLTSDKKIDEKSIYELFINIDDKLTHLEDASADNRALIIKLVKQGNMVIDFLKQFEVSEVPIESISVNDGLSDLPSIIDDEEERAGKIQSIREAIDEYVDKHDQLKELEEELKKNKDKLTPGQIGES